jgi:hypothetical protein
MTRCVAFVSRARARRGRPKVLPEADLERRQGARQGRASETRRRADLSGYVGDTSARCGVELTPPRRWRSVEMKTPRGR